MSILARRIPRRGAARMRVSPAVLPAARPPVSTTRRRPSRARRETPPPRPFRTIDGAQKKFLASGCESVYGLHRESPDAPAPGVAASRQRRVGGPGHEFAFVRCSRRVRLRAGGGAVRRAGGGSRRRRRRDRHRRHLRGRHPPPRPLHRRHPGAHRPDRRRGLHRPGRDRPVRPDARAGAVLQRRHAAHQRRGDLHPARQPARARPRPDPRLRERQAPPPRRRHQLARQRPVRGRAGPRHQRHSGDRAQARRGPPRHRLGAIRLRRHRRRDELRAQGPAGRRIRRDAMGTDL